MPIGKVLEVAYEDSNGFMSSEKVSAFPKYNYYPNQVAIVLSSFNDVTIEGENKDRNKIDYVTNNLEKDEVIYSVKHGGTFPYLMNKSYAFSLKLELERREYPKNILTFNWQKKAELLDLLLKCSNINETVRYTLLSFHSNLQNCLETLHDVNSEELIRIRRLKNFCILLKELSIIHGWHVFDEVNYIGLLDQKQEELNKREWWSVNVEKKIKDLTSYQGIPKEELAKSIASSIYEFEKYNIEKIRKKSKELDKLQEASRQLRLKCENEILAITQQNELMDQLELHFRTFHINGK